MTLAYFSYFTIGFYPNASNCWHLQVRINDLAAPPEPTHPLMQLGRGEDSCHHQGMVYTVTHKNGDDLGMVYWAYTRWIGPNRNFRLFCPRVWFEMVWIWTKLKDFGVIYPWLTFEHPTGTGHAGIGLEKGWDAWSVLMDGWPQPEISVVATLYNTGLPTN